MAVAAVHWDAADSTAEEAQMNYGYVSQRRGGPLLTWKNGPPNPARGADAVAMGCLSEPTLEMPLPRPGAPEPLGCMQPEGANCPGCRGMGGLAATGTAKAAAVALAALLAWRILAKKRR